MGMRYFLGQSMNPDVRKAAGELQHTSASDELLPSRTYSHNFTHLDNSFALFLFIFLQLPTLVLVL
jgi:hypothetical protein